MIGCILSGDSFHLPIITDDWDFRNLRLERGLQTFKTTKDVGEGIKNYEPSQ